MSSWMWFFCLCKARFEIVIFFFFFVSFIQIMNEGSSHIIFIHTFLYFHRNENLVTPLVSPILDSNIFHSWNIFNIIVLSAKNKLELIDDIRREFVEEDVSIKLRNIVIKWFFHGLLICFFQAEAIWNDLRFRIFEEDLLRM